MNSCTNNLIKVNLNSINEKEKENFKNDGFIILKDLISKEQADYLFERSKQLFHGKCDKGIYPDEQYWKPNLSRDDVTREIVNCWKTDSVMAQLVLSEQLGAIACELLECDSVRVAQDDIFWKPVQGKPINFHQDIPYFNFFKPSKVVTIWIALNDVSLENGTLEFAKGSHKWNHDLFKMNDQFHAPEDYLKGLDGAMKREGVDKDQLELVPVTVERGGGSVHGGLLFHGSNKNPSSFNERISIAIHYIPGECEFRDNKPGYIYGRYKIYNSFKLEESFFPIVYSRNGYRSECIKDYCTI
ncbi:hypothetical protein DICPUDRAFT_96115 [Dictyostelium purpureum]|uniref:Phytanoyl-CoA dioxygenase n=1 Tax=Dictyostelium purpureum TaxID=5786 RepID=F1A532_DICPU|nr:uncharacterized protein DICPUDRAFT_96115 [Dictyostelium purpureum]EGC28701.1 hypothetical protein DICPUDRAFT_96115 [Dictyostelium purpureum]|eukprot:XP_003294777.1 hypothetical protein DICPUDRAFT_96115 [Dictyostelium purpureum]